MSKSTSALFKPFVSEKLTLDNRVVMAPMTREFSPGGVPDDDVAAYYRRRAAGGCGLIITEGTTVGHDVASMNPQRIPNFHEPDSLQGWAKVVKEVHAAGGKIAPQLWHVGMMRNPKTTPNPETASAGPSGYLKPGKKVQEGMSGDDVDHVIEAFANAAEQAKNLGFDAVEFHGAHGYLLDQFFWAATNERNDKWGGDIAGRTRFAAEIIAESRRRVGPDFPLILRYSQWKQQDYSQRLVDTPQQLETFLQPLLDAGVDIFHCSTRRFWETEFEGSELNLAGWTKKITGKPTITVGSVGLDGDFMGSFAGESSNVSSLDGLLERLEDDEFDLVAVGRALLTDPEWPNKVKAGDMGELMPFTKEALTALV